MGLLITPSLLNSFDWLSKAPPSINRETGKPWNEEAVESFENMLNRRGWNPSQAIQHGLDFESAVQLHEENRVAGKPLNPKASDTFLRFCKNFERMRFQQNINMNAIVDGDEYYIAGRVDAIADDKIIDIKTSNKFGGNEKYLSGWQHIIYPAATGIESFQYYVAILHYDPNNSYRENRGKATFSEFYVVDGSLDTRRSVESGIRQVIAWINEHPEMKSAYYNRFNRRR